MPQMTAHKAVAAFLTSLIALVALFGVSTDWATPTMIDAFAAVAGAVLSGVVTYMVPNKPKA
jgi:hypothetical protein